MFCYSNDISLLKVPDIMSFVLTMTSFFLVLKPRNSLVCCYLVIFVALFADRSLNRREQS
uniref:Uncharacterized protein n=1 Tax=Arundo donax TaxID=35708 RepID=A0A0A9ATZ7_ARUDO